MEEDRTSSDTPRLTSPLIPAVEFLIRGRCQSRGRHRSLVGNPLAFRERPFPLYSHSVESAICARLAFVASAHRSRGHFTAIRWSPEGSRLVGALSMGEITLWGGSHFTLEDIKRIPMTAGGISALIWTKNGQRLFLGDSGGLVHVTAANIAPLTALRDLRGHSILSLSRAPTDCKIAACAQNAQPVLWDITSCSVERSLTDKGYDSICLDWHPSRGLLAAGAASGELHFWDPRMSEALATLAAHRAAVNGAKWSSCGRWLFTSSTKDGWGKIWDIRRLHRTNSSAAIQSTSGISASAWHPLQTSLLAVGQRDGSLSFLDTSRGSFFHRTALREVRELRPLVHILPDAHLRQAIQDLDFHPHGHILASMANDTTLRFWSRLLSTDVVENRDERITSTSMKRPFSEDYFPVASKRQKVGDS